MTFIPLALGTGCLLLAMSLDRWDVTRWWPMLAYLAAVWAWAAYWQLRRRKAGRR